MNFSSSYVYVNTRSLSYQPQNDNHNKNKDKRPVTYSGEGYFTPINQQPSTFIQRSGLTASSNNRQIEDDSEDDYTKGDKNVSKPARKPTPLNFDVPDTNVVTIRFDKLKDPSTMQAGDAIKCNKCDAYLSSINKLIEINEPSNQQNDKKFWKCEFCGFENNTDIMLEEIPKANDVTYMLQPAPSVTNAATAQDVDSEYFIYCIDVSGSMSNTTLAHGMFRLPTDNIRRRRVEQILGEAVSGINSSNRYISHLEAVQIAITENLTNLAKESPNKKVGLVTFNDEVHAYGDGSTQEVVVSGDFLNNKESIEKKAALMGEFKSVNETNAVLYEKVLKLEEGGETALGPALYFSILIASRKPGSKVILCTDGLANKGIGALDKGDNQLLYYHELAAFAASKGVSVSIITTKGSECKLGVLGEVSCMTGGLVNTVDTMKIKSEFSNILKDEIIATNITAKFVLHNALYVKDYEFPDRRDSFASKEIATATSYTEVTFAFALNKNIDENVTKELPFQLQIVYTSKDGSKALRILTQTKLVTTDKLLAEKNADKAILGAHYLQMNTKLIKEGKVPEEIYKNNHITWNRYLNKDLDSTSNEKSHFSSKIFNECSNELNKIIITTDSVKRETKSNNNSTNSSTTFSNIPDEAASKCFKLANLNSRSLTDD